MSLLATRLGSRLSTKSVTTICEYSELISSSNIDFMDLLKSYHSAEPETMDRSQDLYYNPLEPGRSGGTYGSREDPVLAVEITLPA